MKKIYALACLAVLAVPTGAGAQSIGDIFRSATQVLKGGAVTQSARTRDQRNRAAAEPVLVRASAADFASLKVALDREVARKTPGARALAQARPVVEQLLIVQGCATTAKALHSLNRQRVNPETYYSLDHDLNHTAMGVGSLSTHDRNQCTQVARISNVEQPTLNSLSLTVFFVSPSSGEARSATQTFRYLDGTWLIDKLSWFRNS